MKRTEPLVMPKKYKQASLFILIALFPISLVAGPELSLTLTHVKCYAAKSGAVKLSFSEGNAPYIYILSNDSVHKSEVKRSPLTNEISYLFSEIAAGKYFITAICSNGKAFTKSFIIEQPVQFLPGQISVDSYPSSASAKDGIITANPKGGVLPYSYKWQGNGINGSEKKISGVSMGIVKCSITDGNGCGPVATTIALKTTR